MTRPPHVPRPEDPPRIVTLFQLLALCIGASCAGIGVGLILAARALS